MTLQTSSPSAQVLRLCSMLCRFWCWMSVIDCCRIRCKRLHLMLGWKLHLWPVEPSSARQRINRINLWSTPKVIPVLVLGRPKHNMTVWFPLISYLNTWTPKASLENFLKFLPRKTERQTLLLSATVPDEVLRTDSGSACIGVQETGRNVGITLRFVHV